MVEMTFSGLEYPQIDFLKQKCISILGRAKPKKLRGGTWNREEEEVEL